MYSPAWEPLSTKREKTHNTSISTTNPASVEVEKAIILFRSVLYLLFILLQGISLGILAAILDKASEISYEDTGENEYSD